MKVTIDVPDYTPERGIVQEWEDDYIVEARLAFGACVIRANRAGLISMARHFLMLAQDGVPSGNHHHMDDYVRMDGLGVLEPGSISLIIEKM